MSGFQFKQFNIEQDNCAMKVTTDACIQGAWTPVTGKETRILDIGTGTGLLALMLAQKAPFTPIDAIEFDSVAAIQASENVLNSLWATNISVESADVRTFNFIHCYDLIICNPPFFINSLKNENEATTNARHDTTLQFIDIISIAKRILASNGLLSILLPSAEFQIFIDMATQHGLFLNSLLEIKHTPTSAAKRSIGLFGKNNCELKKSTLTIKSGQEYTDEFKDLLRPYYLYL